MKNLVFLLLLISKVSSVVAQQTVIKFQNPSFEKPPFVAFQKEKKGFKYEKYYDDIDLHKMGWFPCGFSQQSPPDWQPGQFGVYSNAKHGNHYLGMVARPDTTWEGISQQVSSTLQKDSCYEFSIYLMHSLTMSSFTSTNKTEQIYFKTPCRLRVWGGNEYCDPRELLIETPSIHNTKWKQYTLRFTAPANIKYIYFETYYRGEKAEAGNIMMDKLSDIHLISCK